MYYAVRKRADGFVGHRRWGYSDHAKKYVFRAWGGEGGGGRVVRHLWSYARTTVVRESVFVFNTGVSPKARRGCHVYGVLG